ncbi:hypothetical protein PoB_005543500 [Plakobranchus ocellatus]|uniref:Uncharacterized protein n=1 Tax=Plakobranchus ocellatus TaxID=259542 RepID=A0AAV4C878_9GAST|nr:hypothetical protein PoB_005543500 [Plakobranchus ocellatus]
MRHRKVPAARMNAVEDDDKGSGCDDCDCEILPELGGWGSKETVKDLMFDYELSTEQDVNWRSWQAVSLSLFSATTLVRQH